MKQLTTQAIILGRTDYGEADRILSLLTPQYGKLSLLAKGVRRIKSKLAGGIELFSVSEITFIQGRGAVGTLVSTRLSRHYDQIVGNLERTMLGYELIKRLNKGTEDQPEPEYFELLQEAFEALNDPSVSLPVIRFWFDARLLGLAGHTPNLQTDLYGRKLAAEQTYDFDFEHMSFTQQGAAAGEDEAGRAGRFSASHIKLLRLAFAGNSPKILSQIKGNETLTAVCDEVTRTMSQTFLRV